MKYKAPIINNKPYYVPIVVKDKSYLVGYINALVIFKILKKYLDEIGIFVDMSVFDNCLSSTRFNGIMFNDKKISENEIKDYLENVIENKLKKIEENHPDNNNLDDSLLKIECPCGFGFYSFNKIEDIPETSLKCSICGRIILDYTGHYDNEYDVEE